MIAIACRYPLIVAVVAVPAANAQTPASFTCPVTLPNHVNAPGAWKHYAADGHTWFENGLWISIPTDGVLLIGPAQQVTTRDSKYFGWGSEKLILLRGEGVRGMVEITGQRLDQPSDKAAFNDTKVDHFYGETGFVPIALMIPGAGCWQFTATAGDASATWVLDVRAFLGAGTPEPQ
ncbi:MAG: hypothetical protein M9934_02020 [Thermomicrobiales bacterium]|nr:hypothetical protein [Thermomicrobiales bacterium]